MADNEDDLGRTPGLPLTDEQRAELVARQARLNTALAEVEAAQHERDACFAALNDAGVDPNEMAKALGVHRLTVTHALTDHRKAEAAQRLAADAPRAAAQAALDRAQEHVDQAWQGRPE
ncbi:hypothetical protein LWC35_21230 [Pseudonocardia kujensis]|uniref:hypothetical protein n=1 Tax=Pseudonocardia kujensis TaxID=1128675 RepID=UPI001E55B78B|nr:hypothetical protein [Pseudonocardia kujensis]MCE0765405.1 hypothetical protein [Pseudonocardia kujensis]